MKLPTKKTQPLGIEPLYNEECNVWYFDQLFFIIDGKRVDITGTELINNSKDYILYLKTQSDKRFSMKMSEIVSQFKGFWQKQNKEIKEPIKTKTIINNQNKLDI